VYLVINLNFVFVRQVGPTEVIRFLSCMQQGARNVRNSKFRWPTETDMEPHGFDTGQGTGLRLERFCGTICLYITGETLRVGLHEGIWNEQLNTH